MFAPDGTLYVLQGGLSQGTLSAFDSSGKVKAGWPIQAPNGAGYEATQGFAVAVNDTLLVATPTSIIALDSAGKPLPGWPVALPEGFGQILLGSGGQIAVVQQSPSTNQTLVVALRLGSSTPTLWSTKIAGASSSVIPAQMSSEGTIYIAGAASEDGHFAVCAVKPDGTVGFTWSKTLSNAMAVTASGDLVLVSYETKAVTSGQAQYDVLGTDVSIIDPSGSSRAGWPQTFVTPLSAPAIGTDGNLYFVAGNGTGTGSVLALDDRGNTRAGWPATLPSGFAGLTPAQVAGHTNVSEPPLVGNGMLYVAAANTEGDQIVAGFTLDGQTPSGWPYHVPKPATFTGSIALPLVLSSAGSPLALETLNPSSGAVVALADDGTAAWAYSFAGDPGSLTLLSDGSLGIFSTDFAVELSADGKRRG